MSVPIKYCGWNLRNINDKDGAPVPDGTRATARYFTDDHPDEPLPIAAKVGPAGSVSLRLPSSALTDGARTGRYELDLDGYKPLGVDPAAHLRCDVPPVGDTEGIAVDQPDGSKHHPGLDPYPLPRLEPSATPFPTDVAVAPLPTWDPSDGYGIVHTEPIPGVAIPKVRDLMYIRADFDGVTIPGNYTPTDTASIIANGGVTVTDGPYAGLFIPFVNGANTTPPTMLMTPQLVLYPEPVIQAFMHEYIVKRQYTHFVWDQPWENPPLSDDAMIAWGKRIVHEFGLFSIVWRGEVSIGDPLCQKLDAAGVQHWICIGEENDRKMSAEDYKALVEWYLATFPTTPCAAHFTDNYPEGFPRDTFITNWADYDGRLHLFWQANQNDSAGRQGAMFYYGRLRVNLGKIGGDGRPAPNSRCYMFENEASNELTGVYDETYSCLRGTEIMQCPANDPGVRPAPDGFGNGGRDPDGRIYGWRTWT